MPGQTREHRRARSCRIKQRPALAIRTPMPPAGGKSNHGKAAAGQRKLHGAAIIKASSIRSAKLDVIAGEGPPRHAAIRGWPWPDDDDLRTAQHKARALILASRVTDLLIYSGK